MYGAIGICNSNVHRITQFLEGHVKYKVVGLNETLTSDKAKGVLLFPTLQLFLRNYEGLVNTKSIPIIFSNAVLLEYMSPLNILDLDEKKNSYQYTYKKITQDALLGTIQSIREEKTYTNVTQQSLDVIPTLLHSQPPSLLAPVLNYMYSMPNTNNRLKVQRVIFGWLLVDKATDVLKDELLNHSKDSTALSSLLEFLESEDGIKYKKAFVAIGKLKEEGKAYTAKTISKKFNVSDYDISYAMAYYNRSFRQSIILESEPLSKQFWERRNAGKVRSKDKIELLRREMVAYESLHDKHTTLSYVLSKFSWTKEEVLKVYEKVTEKDDKLVLIEDC